MDGKCIHRRYPALHEIKRTYNDVKSVSELKNQAQVVVRKFGDEKLAAHFKSLTTFWSHTDDSIRLDKTNKAIDVAILDFELKSKVASQINTPPLPSKFNIGRTSIFHVEAIFND